MKIKKAFDICKKAKTIILYRLGDVQMLSDGVAIYPLDSLPELDEEFICQLYDINDKQREKIRFAIDEPLPFGYEFADTDPAETVTQIMDFSIKMDGCGVLLPIVTEFASAYDNGHNIQRYPLAEIPTPHGRLIDADNLKCPLSWQGEIVRATIREAPTIIEAEVSE